MLHPSGPASCASHPRLLRGSLSENDGAKMGWKWVIFGGFGRQKGGQNGEFRPPEAGKKATFCVPEG